MITNESPAGRHVDQRQEGPEEHHRAAQVADEDQQDHRRAPDHQQWPEVLERRQHEAHELPSADHQHLPALVQVAGEEDDDADLRQLSGLEGDRPEVDREVGVVDGVPQEARQNQQDDPGERDQVAVALEGLVVAQEDDGRREEDEPEHEPVGLVARKTLIEAIEHHEPERRQQGDQGEEERVGVGQPDPDHEVRRDADGEEIGPVEDARIELIGVGDQHGRESGRDQQGDRDQGKELASAGAQLFLACWPFELAPDFFFFSSPAQAEVAAAAPPSASP